MDIGDVVEYLPMHQPVDAMSRKIGIVIEFPIPTHAKEFQKVKVLRDGGYELWIMQFCKIVSELPQNS